MCERKWAETQERVYRFDKAVSLQMISCFMSYAYHRDYVHSTQEFGSITLPLAGTTSDKREVVKNSDPKMTDGAIKDERYHPVSLHSEAAHPLLLHIQLYVFGDTYIMRDLQKLARGKICQALKELASLDIENVREMVFDLMEYAFDNLREEDIMLTFLSLYASNKLQSLRLSTQRFETLMMGSDGKFVRHILPKISGSSKDVFSLTDDNLKSFPLNGDAKTRTSKPRDWSDYDI